MQIIDGKQVASQVLEEVGKDIARLREQGITPGLAVVLVGGGPRLPGVCEFQGEKMRGAGNELP